MPVMKRAEDGTLVGEILVERADADAGGLGDAIGGDGVSAVALDHELDRLEHIVHGLA